MSIDESQRARVLRRDAELSRLVSQLAGTDAASLATDVVAWGMARDAERRSLAEEALDRYRELNLLYDVADRCKSLDPKEVIGVAAEEVGRLCRRAVTVGLVTDEGGHKIVSLDPEPGLARLPADGFSVGQGIVGAVAAGADGEIVNDVPSDPRATAAELAIGALMVVPLRARGRVLGVLLTFGRPGADFSAGELRMLSAVAALTAPALDAALAHVRMVALAHAREAELEQQLAALRSEVEASRREQRVSEITGTDYFRSLREQADVLRSAIDAEPSGGRG